MGYPGSGKTTATLRFNKKLKRRGTKIITLDSSTTNYDFKKQSVPVEVSLDKAVAWVGKPPEMVPKHRQRLGGTEAYSRYQYNMLDRVLLALIDRGYRSIVMDGFAFIRPSLRKAITKIRNRGHKFNVMHLTTPYEQSREAWFSRERKASKTCDAAKRKLKHKEMVGAENKLDEYHRKFEIITEQADKVIPVTRETIGTELDKLLI